MNISIKKTIYAFSLCLDIAARRDDFFKRAYYQPLNGRHEFSTGLKINSFIALSIAKELKLNEQTSYLLYISSIINNFMSNDMMKEIHKRAMFSDDSLNINKESLREIKIIAQVLDILKQSCNDYALHNPNELYSEDSLLPAQIIKLSNGVCSMFDCTKNPISESSAIIKSVEGFRNAGISKEVCDAFISISSREVFWFNLFNLANFNVSYDNLIPKLDSHITLEEFEVIADIFACLIDSKSPFTHTHSLEISRLAYDISCFLGYDEERCLKMKIAGLLHDVGKIAVPSEILDKDGPLTEDEFNIVKAHPFYTKLILDRVGDIKDISLWASSHHEKLNGEGYPFHLKAEDLTEECRILCVCDIYQALTADRPYRRGMYIYEAFDILNDMAERGLVCKNAVATLKNTLIDKDEERIKHQNAMRNRKFN